MPKFRTFRDDKPAVETTNPGSSKARGEGCTCPVVANAYGRGTGDPRAPQFTTDPACPLHGSALLPEVEAGQLRCQRCARGVVGRQRFCEDCLSVRSREYFRNWKKDHRAKACRCETCAEPFLAVVADARWCPTCRGKRKAARLRERWDRGEIVFTPRTCVDCGKTFQPTGANHKHCGCTKQLPPASSEAA